MRPVEQILAEINSQPYRTSYDRMLRELVPYIGDLAAAARLVENRRTEEALRALDRRADDLVHSARFAS